MVRVSQLFIHEKKIEAIPMSHSRFQVECAIILTKAERKKKIKTYRQKKIKNIKFDSITKKIVF